jgi:parallel beta-helix repeat protein
VSAARRTFVRRAWRVLAGAMLAGIMAAFAPLAPKQTDGPNEPATIPAWTMSPPAGPRPDISCPAESVKIAPGTSIQVVVDTYPGHTTFCLGAGIHPITNAITPKTGDTFVGQYGAILDGSGWTTNDATQAAFRAHNENIDDVTIRNLVIRRMPVKGIHASVPESDNWTIEYNAVTANGTGVAAPRNSTVRHNSIDHNRTGGYSAFRAENTTFEANDISYNGGEQKIVATTNVVFRNNVVHDNEADGIWYDTDNAEAIVEGNVVEDNGRDGISYEISARGLIRNNIVRRSGSSGIFISTSKDVEIADNVLENNQGGIQYFLNCEAVGGGSHNWDLANNVAHDNRLKIEVGVMANVLRNEPNCTPSALAPYLNGLKGLVFRNNHYAVRSPALKYWFWGSCCSKTWSEWQALGQDVSELREF